jgi:uncharacterized protein YPO0396
MGDGLFSTLDIDVPQRRTGYRLHHLEVYNWGTFHQRVWRLTAGGDTALMTGDIGSGKSTLVDAVTTLLLPANKIAYNKAAGAESKERTLRSYVEGHYKSERVESTGNSRAVGLRDSTSYSVILGVFTNDGYDGTVTLAQVFHQKERTGQPDRFFVTSTKELSVEADFTDFGSELNQLRRRLRAAGAEITLTFPDYSRQMRRLLGIRSEQAMELFHQTVSMKSVGNLNEFVRDHMLEPVDAADRVKAIVAHFEDLTKAHEAVRRAKDQLAALDPLVALCDRHDDAAARRTAAERQRDAVRTYVSELAIRLLGEELARHDATRQARRDEAADVARQRDDLVPQRDALIEERAVAGGDRLGELERSIAEWRAREGERRDRRARFAALLEAAGLHGADDAASFADRRIEAQQLAGTVLERGRELDEAHAGHRARRETIDQAGVELRAELQSLAARRSNLPRASLLLRERLCADLGLDAAELPFAGELIDVREDFAPWRGAAERVLRGFALSLLVPQEHYPQVSRWVNGRFLDGQRLVYHRVPLRRVPTRPVHAGQELQLAQTLEVQPGPFADYLREELGRRADHRCVDSMEDFQAAHKAVTREGQTRSGDRHEKDDRSRVDDPRTWVLGWTNERKVAALTDQLTELQAELLDVDARLARVTREREQQSVRSGALGGLAQYTSWPELDWAEAADRVAAAESERDRLLAGSSRLAEIERQLLEIEASATELDRRLTTLRNEIAVLDKDIERAEATRDTQRRRLETMPPGALEVARSSYDDLAKRLGAQAPTTAADCEGVTTELTGELQAVIDRAVQQLSGFALKITQQMTDVRRRWPEATTEMDASVEASADYRAFRDRVAGDDLPRFEAEFKRQLNTNTIRELAAFNSWLRRQAEEIHGRVERINEALGAIDYSPGRYIKLVAEPTVNQEVKQFRTELRAATDDMLGSDDDRYSEQRFRDVQRIIERFRGRDGHADADKAWTRRVTDVRNWFTFSADELDKETNEAWEHYADSDGKSGGQKEKLAYTILAASLAYQFGLEWGVERSRDFRFAVIDEAFGRGSDVSTRYALDLFGKLGLQLLIVTPLQKVHVIEPYVHAIGFVDNPSGSYSRLQTLTIEEFREQRRQQAG